MNPAQPGSLTFTLVCDVCEGAATYNTTPPSGWVSLPIANWAKRALDLDFKNPEFTLDVCPTCIEKGRRP